MDTVSRCLCLGMLALLATTYQLPTKNTEYAYLVGEIKEVLCDIRFTCEHFDLAVWLLFAGALSGMVEFDWLPLSFKDMYGLTGFNWQTTRDNLKDIVWIDSIHDGPGKSIFDHFAASL